MGSKNADKGWGEEPKVKKDLAKPKSDIRAAVAAHLAGIPWDVIATRYTFSSPKSAQIAVETLIGETWTSTDLAAARAKSLARKERMLQSVWEDATSPWTMHPTTGKRQERNDAHLQALDRALRIAESIDRLQGLNAPTQVEVYRPGADEFLSTVGELRAIIMRDLPEEADIFDAEIMDEDGGEDADPTSRT
jgi:hypothetical protein